MPTVLYVAFMWLLFVLMYLLIELASVLVESTIPRAYAVLFLQVFLSGRLTLSYSCCHLSSPYARYMLQIFSLIL